MNVLVRSGVLKRSVPLLTYQISLQYCGDITACT